jgi:Resolvase, N terminal domain
MAPRAKGKRVLIYGRVSFLAARTGQKRPSNETTVERQFKACEQYAAAQGRTVVGKRRDEVSGFKDVRRPGWDQVVQGRGVRRR